MTTTDNRPTLYLGHLVIPNVSAAEDWLQRQGNKRDQAREIVIKVAREWLGGDASNLPDVFFEMFADRVVTELDHRI